MTHMTEEQFAQFIQDRTTSINAIAYESGVLAYRVGRPLTSCAFKEDQFAEVWRQGWLAAEDEALAKIAG
jgi:hypothetical protein